MACSNNWINSSALREADRAKNTKYNHADALRITMDSMNRICVIIDVMNRIWIILAIMNGIWAIINNIWM